MRCQLEAIFEQGSQREPELFRIEFAGDVGFGVYLVSRIEPGRLAGSLIVADVPAQISKSAFAVRLRKRSRTSAGKSIVAGWLIRIVQA